MGRQPCRTPPPKTVIRTSFLTTAASALPLLLPLVLLAVIPGLQPAAAHNQSPPSRPRAPRPPAPVLNPQGCAALALQYGIVPGASWGSADPPAQQLWTASDCDALVCVQWRAKYGVVPFVSWGSLPEELKASWEFTRTANGHNTNCNLLSGPLDSLGCGLLADQFGVVPYASWGSASADAQTLYTRSDCDAQVCSYWKVKYGVVPYASWGSLPDALKAAWDHPREAHGGKTCNSLSSPGGLDTASCGGLVDGLGVKPGYDWGRADQEARDLYASSACDVKVCEHWRAKYGVVPYGSWGSLPKELYASWELPRTSRGGATCNSLSGPLDPTSCAALVKSYNVQPGFSMGSAPQEARAMYDSSECEVKVCSAWRAQYGVVPYKTYGTLPEALKASWDYARPSKGGRSCTSLSGDLGPSGCGAVAETYGIVPGPSTEWGTAPQEARSIYTESECDVRLCEYWKGRYGVVPGRSWGSMPQHLRPSWDYARPSRNGQNCNTLFVDTTGLARRFAPVLQFHSDQRGYPSTPQAYFDAGCHTKACSKDEWLNKPRDPNAHVYYAVTTCGGQVRIRYHFFYAWQPPCMTEPVEKGAHQADWEAVTLLLSEDMTRVAAVTFGQHGGRYTRVAGRDGFQTSSGKPVVYVGKHAHGFYHDSQANPLVGALACTYFGDPRGGGVAWDTGRTVLVDLQAAASASAEPWIAAMLSAPDQAILWEAGKGIRFAASQWAPPCSETACTGTGLDLSGLVGIGTKDTGCSLSQCRTGWKDAGVLNGCYRCTSGYIDCGGSCARGTKWYDCINPGNTDRQGYQTTKYDYTLPTSDEGLL